MSKSASDEKEADDKSANTCIGVGCSLFFVIAVIAVCVGLIVDCASEDKPAPTPTKNLEEIIRDTEFTDEHIRAQDALIEQCVFGEVAKGRISQIEASTTLMRTRDRTDLQVWKTFRVLLTLDCIDKGYGDP